LYEETRDTWERHLDRLPVSIDVPRLVMKMKIIDKNGQLVLDGNQNQKTEPIPGELPLTKQQLIKKILLVLANQLGEDEQVIQEQYNTYVKDNAGDIPGPLNRFLKNVMGEENKVVKVLKACNQSILAPAVVRLKLKIAKKLPYKDMRGAWSIAIHVNQNDLIVFHRKNEISWNPNPNPTLFQRDSGGDVNLFSNPMNSEDDFKFAWELSLKFDRQMQQLYSVSLAINSVEFDDSMPTHKRLQILSVMRDYFHPCPVILNALIYPFPKSIQPPTESPQNGRPHGGGAGGGGGGDDDDDDGDDVNNTNTNTNTSTHSFE